MEELYREVEPMYDMHLVTKSCFHKVIGWTHIVENPEFIELLHGDELIFSAGIQYTSEEWLMDFVQRLIEAGTGGLVLSLHEGSCYPQRIVDYCNRKKFPLFSSGWKTPYLDVMRIFASILLENEQRDTNLNEALKNAIYYPEHEAAYLHHFEHNGFYRNMHYIMAILSCHAYREGEENKRLQELAKQLQYSDFRGVVVTDEDRLLIMGHRMADIDSFGAAIGIYRIAVSMNKKANIVVNEVTSSVRPMMERFTGNADYPEDMFLTGARAAEMVDPGTMLVVVDVNRPSITDEPSLLQLVKTIVVLDHHRASSEIIDNAVLSYVEPYASSTCEMVAEVLQYIADGIKVKPPEADAMYAGIVIDTQNFTNQTGVRTFEAAAFLRRSGADVTRVRKLFRENMVDYQAKAEAVRAAEVYMDAFAISVCPSEGVESPTVVGAQAANELLEIRGIKASIVLTEYNGIIYFSARSIDEVNVQVMMEKLGGGGHRTIAGAQMKGVTVEEAKKYLKEVIGKMLEEGEVS